MGWHLKSSKKINTFTHIIISHLQTSSMSTLSCLFQHGTKALGDLFSLHFIVIDSLKFCFVSGDFTQMSLDSSSATRMFWSSKGKDFVKTQKGIFLTWMFHIGVTNQVVRSPYTLLPSRFFCFLMSFPLH